MSMLRMNGFDDCIIGVIERCGQPDILCYDTGKIRTKLVSQGMSREEAEEYFAFNQLGAWVGDTTPGFLRPLEEDDV